MSFLAKKSAQLLFMCTCGEREIYTKTYQSASRHNKRTHHLGSRATKTILQVSYSIPMYAAPHLILNALFQESIYSMKDTHFRSLPGL